MKKIFYCLVAAFVLAACVKEDVSIAKIEEVKNPYAVTPDEAVQLLKTVIGGESTRAVSVGEIKTLRKSDFVPTTRGAEDGDVIYIVDLENGGSAVMGADKRMEPIYAILDETKISAEQLITSATRSDDGEQNIEEYVMGLMNAKIGNDISLMAAGDLLLPEMPIIPRPQFWTETVVIARQTPLLRTKWGQEAPFNNNFPMKASGLFRCPAGCTTIATAQIMYHNRRPNAINGMYIDWNLISQYEFDYENPSNSATIELANFIYQVAEGVDSEYNEGNDILGTGSNINLVKSLLSASGYLNVTKSNYSLSSIITMVSTHLLPVYISGTSTNSNEGHAWVIDGCNIYKIEHWERNFQTEFIYTDSIESVDEYNLVHCNYGYNANCDGYYTSRIFDTRVMREYYLFEPDYGDAQDIGTNNFSSDLEILTYSLN